MHKGQCQCGLVQIEVEDLPKKIGACYCAICRKINGGGPQLGVHGTSELKASGAEHIQRYASSDWAERGFCNKCGTTLFYHLTVGPQDYIYSAGLFNDYEFEITSEIFIDAKPDFMGLFKQRQH